VIVSEASLAALLLTNRLVDVAAKPLSAGEYWALLAKVPDVGVLFGIDEQSVGELLGGDTIAAQRVTTLLAATTAFAYERERLEEEGISLLSTFDPAFPSRLINRLGTTCPAFLTVAGPVEWLSAGALVGGGAVVGIPAEGLRVAARSPEVRRRVHNGELCIASPYAPAMRFTAGNAMGRNKIVYGLADVTLVVCSDDGTGGTWEGAKEAIRRSFGPVAVWSGDGEGLGNAALIALGGTSITNVHAVLDAPEHPNEPRVQGSLF
jgi:predicted Rossmann fold nucleotide-binding protein DprA/Smf involved in DNA uptake